MFIHKVYAAFIYVYSLSFPSPMVLQKHAGSLLEGFMQTQISTLAVKDNFLVAGGFQGELTCKVNFLSLYLTGTSTPVSFGV